jgi:hypothetical protein
MALKHMEENTLINLTKLQALNKINSNTTSSNQILKRIEKIKERVVSHGTQRKRRQGVKLKLSEEEMKKEKDAMRSQYENPPECDDFEIIIERSKKFNK